MFREWNMLSHIHSNLYLQLLGWQFWLQQMIDIMLSGMVNKFYASLMQIRTFTFWNFKFFVNSLSTYLITRYLKVISYFKTSRKTKTSHHFFLLKNSHCRLLDHVYCLILTKCLCRTSIKDPEPNHLIRAAYTERLVLPKGAEWTTLQGCCSHL